MKNFKKPVFEDGSVEFRIDNDEVSVYGTKDGLTRLSELCQNLLSNARLVAPSMFILRTTSY